MNKSSAIEQGISSLGLLEIFKKKYGLGVKDQLPNDTIQALKNVEEKNRHITNPTIRPLVDNTPTAEAVAKWRKQFLDITDVKRDQWEALAGLLVQNLTRVSQDAFEAELVKAYSSASLALSGVGENTRFIFYSGGRNRSNEWAKSIAREHLPGDPVLRLPSIDYHGIDYDDEIPKGQFEVGIILDDASYSAQQVIGHFKFGHKNFGMNKFIIILPYMTNYAREGIIQFAKQEGLGVDIFNPNIIPTADEVLDPDMYKTLKIYAPVSSPLNQGLGLTYFAHKVPDERSFLPFLGYTRAVQLNSRLDPLVPKAPAVYHAEYLERLQLGR